MTPPRPGPPRDLSKPFATLWRETRKALEDQKTWQESDGELLSRYIRALERAELLREGMQEDGRYKWVVEGSKHQDVSHPNLKPMVEAERDADKRAAMLLLSPEARHRNAVKAKAASGGKFDL